MRIAANFYNYQNMNEGTGVIVLAAGNSSRMGKSKQLLPFKGKTFLQLALDAAVDLSGGPVIVVLGFEADKIAAGINSDRIRLVINEKWPEGMGGSIALGMEYLLNYFPSTDSVIITVCDQPFADVSVLRNLQQRRENSGKGIIASSYSGTKGTPALFQRKYYSELQQLSGLKGAKSLIERYKEDVDSVYFPEGHIDVDSPEEYENLIKNTSYNEYQHTYGNL